MSQLDKPQSAQPVAAPDCAKCGCMKVNHIPANRTEMKQKCMSCDNCDGYVAVAAPTPEENERLSMNHLASRWYAEYVTGPGPTLSHCEQLAAFAADCTAPLETENAHLRLRGSIEEERADALSATLREVEETLIANQYTFYMETSDERTLMTCIGCGRIKGNGDCKPNCWFAALLSRIRSAK